MARRPETVSFVARIWLEPGPEGPGTWRGRIQHVQSGQHAYFQDLEQMRGFLEGIAGVQFPLQARGPARNRPEG